MQTEDRTSTKRPDTRRTEKTRHAGIYRRHRSRCVARRCDCPWVATVWSARDGKLIRRQFRSEGEARTWREDARGAVRRDAMRAPTQRTLAEAAAEWLKGAKDGSIRSRNKRPYKPSAVRGYELALRDHVLTGLGHLKLSELDRNHCQDFADAMLAEGDAPSTVLNALNPLQAIVRRAVRRGEVPVNPTADLDLPRPTGRRERAASPTEARALLDALPEDQRALWATAFYAGLRRGELRALRWGDVDLDANVLRVERSWDDIEGPVEAKTKAARRRVPVPAELRAHLLRKKLRAGSPEGDALAFGETPHTAFQPSTVRRRALAAWKRENETRAELDDEPLEPIALHECRHTFASLMIAAGVNAKALSTYMGHASVTITYDRYGHLMPGNEEEAAALLDAYLNRGVSIGTA
jgi:integrase